jgi:hypothetical protein
VYYEADVVTHEGATYQALRDTARAPPHAEHWICLASAGRDAITPTVRGTFDTTARYKKLDIATFDRSAFIARHDDPGPCPSNGWQLITAHGAPGEKGPPGPRGERGTQGSNGEPGASIVDWHIDRPNYQAIPVMSDGALKARRSRCAGCSSNSTRRRADGARDAAFKGEWGSTRELGLSQRGYGPKTDHCIRSLQTILPRCDKRHIG